MEFQTLHQLTDESVMRSQLNSSAKHLLKSTTRQDIQFRIFAKMYHVQHVVVINLRPKMVESIITSRRQNQEIRDLEKGLLPH